VASLSQGRTAAAQCGLFTYKSVPVIFEPPCTSWIIFGCHSEKLSEALSLFIAAQQAVRKRATTAIKIVCFNANGQMINVSTYHTK